MKKSYLFPTYFKKIGWVITLSNLILLLINGLIDNIELKFQMFAFYGSDVSKLFVQDSGETGFFHVVETSYFTTLFPILFILGLIFVAFSKHKNEDEYISKIREQSLVWSMIVGYLIFILLTLFLYGTVYIAVIMYDIYLFLILFIFKFNFELYRLKKSLRNEE